MKHHPVRLLKLEVDEIQAPNIGSSQKLLQTWDLQKHGMFKHQTSSNIGCSHHFAAALQVAKALRRAQRCAAVQPKDFGPSDKQRTRVEPQEKDEGGSGGGVKTEEFLFMFFC